MNLIKSNQEIFLINMFLPTCLSYESVTCIHNLNQLGSQLISFLKNQILNGTHAPLLQRDFFSLNTLS